MSVPRARHALYQSVSGAWHGIKHVVAHARESLPLHLAHELVAHLEAPQLVAVGAHHRVEAHLHEEDVRRGVAIPAALRRVAVAAADRVRSGVGLERLRRLGEVDVRAALAGQRALGRADLPLDVSARIVRDLVAVEGEDVDVGIDAGDGVLPLPAMLRAVAVCSSEASNSGREYGRAAEGLRSRVREATAPGGCTPIVSSKPSSAGAGFVKWFLLDLFACQDEIRTCDPL